MLPLKYANTLQTILQVHRMHDMYIDNFVFDLKSFTLSYIN